VFFSAGSLLAAPFDLQQRKMTGAAVPVVNDVYVAPSNGAVVAAAISASGTLVYAPTPGRDTKSRLVVVDAAGTAQPLTDFLPQHLRELTVSPDGQRVAVRVVKANDDIHVFDIPRSSLTRFTYEGGDELTPVWTPDGKRIAYTARRGNTPAMFWKPADGNVAPERILDAHEAQRPNSFSPDGKYLAYAEIDPQTGGDIWTVRLDDNATRHPEPFLRTPFYEDLPVFSPDGRWIAFRSDESGRREVYVAQFPGAAIKQQVSIDGGDQPLWAPSGQQLFFVDGDRLMTVDLDTTSGLRAGKPRELFHGPLVRDEPRMPGRSYAVFPDGKRFLFVERAPQPEIRELVVVLNWLEELKRKVK
jgi:serine/threonine-protein kinase